MLVFARVLPNRILAPNAGTRPQVVDEQTGEVRDQHRNGEQVVNAMYSLGDAVYHAILNGVEQPYPQIMHAVVTMTWYINHGARKCPRCRGRCQCYRPRVPSNFGADIATPILDALVKHDIIGGKTWDYVDEVRYRIREEDITADEGVLVEVIEADE